MCVLPCGADSPLDALAVPVGLSPHAARADARMHAKSIAVMGWVGDCGRGPKVRVFSMSGLRVCG